MEPIDKINTLLSEKGITGAELSRALGFSTGAYSQWNTKKTRISKKSLKKIADYLGVSVGFLLGTVERSEDGVFFSDGSGFGGGLGSGSGFGDGSGYGGPLPDLKKEKPTSQKDDELSDLQLEAIAKIKKMDTAELAKKMAAIRAVLDME